MRELHDSSDSDTTPARDTSTASIPEQPRPGQATEPARAETMTRQEYASYMRQQPAVETGDHEAKETAHQPQPEQDWTGPGERAQGMTREEYADYMRQYPAADAGEHDNPDTSLPASTGDEWWHLGEHAQGMTREEYADYMRRGPAAETGDQNEAAGLRMPDTASGTAGATASRAPHDYIAGTSFRDQANWARQTPAAWPGQQPGEAREQPRSSTTPVPGEHRDSVSSGPGADDHPAPGMTPPGGAQDGDGTGFPPDAPVSTRTTDAVSQPGRDQHPEQSEPEATEAVLNQRISDLESQNARLMEAVEGLTARLEHVEQRTADPSAVIQEEELSRADQDKKKTGHERGWYRPTNEGIAVSAQSAATALTIMGTGYMHYLPADAADIAAQAVALGAMLVPWARTHRERTERDGT